jgi:hypothetical protein
LKNSDDEKPKGSDEEDTDGNDDSEKSELLDEFDIEKFSQASPKNINKRGGGLKN